MIAACIKWVARRDEAAGPGDADGPDARFAGASPADQAALEWALRARAAWSAHERHAVVAITVGPAGADAVLRDALAAGADAAVRIDAAFGTPSRVVADLIAGEIGGNGQGFDGLIFCGDYSSDRGTGAVPAFLAARLGIAQALGVVAVELLEPGSIEALRRVDGGRRDRLDVTAPVVMSVEGSTALLRRAPLRSMLARHEIRVVPSRRGAEHADATTSRPYRPRARTLAPPAGSTALERVRALTSAGAATVHGDPITLDPAAAAAHILDALADWSYLPPR